MDYKRLKDRAMAYMRRAESDEDACYIIEDLTDEIMMLEDKLIDKDYQLSKAEDDIDHLKHQIEMLEDRILDLEI